MNLIEELTQDILKNFEFSKMPTYQFLFVEEKKGIDNINICLDMTDKKQFLRVNGLMEGKVQLNSDTKLCLLDCHKMTGDERQFLHEKAYEYYKDRDKPITYFFIFLKEEHFPTAQALRQWDLRQRVYFEDDDCITKMAQAKILEQSLFQKNITGFFKRKI